MRPLTLCLLLTLLPAPSLAQLRPSDSKPPPRAARTPAGVNATRDIEYAKFDNGSLHLDIYQPAKLAPDAKLPLIVWVHGGAWAGGDKRHCPTVALVSQGYVVASINYRLTQEAIYPAQIQDCKGAIRFLRANAAKYQIDPDHVGVFGSSAGGHLAALLGTSAGEKPLEGDIGGNAEQSSAVQAVCDWCGPTDLRALAVHKAAQKTGRKASAINALVGGPAEMLDLARSANPIAYVDKSDPPFLIMHGEDDIVVPISQSEVLHKALADAGVEVTFKPLPQTPHGGAGFVTRENRQLVADFFAKHLKPAPAAKP